MSRRNWKQYRPHSLLDALRACKDHAAEKKNLSVERIADLMGVTSDLLYKWLSTGRIPAVQIPTYEHVCGVNFVSDWLSRCAGKLVMTIPTGRSDTDDIQVLQASLHGAVGALLAFYAQRTTREETQAALISAMEQLGWHHINVTKFEQPEFEM